ncbi:MAG: gliding motility lipoprotein GldH [Fimbriimonadaceae bacterium]|nr:gliding motility lipoprotein GldH [Chitinophagales bacterium]
MTKNNFLADTIIIFACVCAITGCTKTNLYDKNISIEKNTWMYDDAKKFEVTIIDSASIYNLFINVRHTDAYAFNNMWLRITTILPDSSRTEDKVNVQLAQDNGAWTGNCVDGVCYNSVLVMPNFTFTQTGTYTFLIEQDMRINPVTNILDIGIRIERF